MCVVIVAVFDQSALGPDTEDTAVKRPLEGQRDVASICRRSPSISSDHGGVAAADMLVCLTLKQCDKYYTQLPV